MRGFVVALCLFATASARTQIPKGRRLHVQVQVGNTFSRIPPAQAALSRTGEKKIWDWELSVTPTGGDPDAIRGVVIYPDMVDNTFLPESYVKTVPPYRLRQQAWGKSTAKIDVILSDGRTRTIYKKIRMTQDNMVTFPIVYYDKASVQPAHPSAVTTRAFGVEIELAADLEVNLDSLRRRLEQATGETVLAPGFTKNTMKAWKVISDDSVASSDPDRKGIEVVSPILRGVPGLARLRSAIESLEGTRGVSVPRSCGLHVHVDLTDVSFEGLQHICQSWIMYEGAIDLMMPWHRRADMNKYCLASRSNMRLTDLGNDAAHRLIAAQTNIKGLARVMNSHAGGRTRYFKLNLQNLVTGTKNTLEFRGHAGTLGAGEVEYWVRFLNAFVEGSLKLPPAFEAFDDSRTPKYIFDRMFERVVRDTDLRDFYTGRCEL
ncbi:putative amidoligase enzyme-domain-containing protein [Pavlovales sp. CCMP2436]|nr:putative amidoligase enzyme-domain-containing protein [Pavlovales sp. CCMP2436]